MSDKNTNLNKPLSLTSKRTIAIIFIAVVLIAIPLGYFLSNRNSKIVEDVAVSPDQNDTLNQSVQKYWIAPSIDTISDVQKKEQIAYGKDLIAHTAKYLGPKGSVKQISNGMNCQNCHLQAGTAVFGNNYGSVASLYPKFRARSASIENIEKRVNDCIERSLNGKPLNTTSKEMLAIVAYVNFLGANVKKGEKAVGSGFKDLAYLDRAADPLKGQAVYAARCVICHQTDGSGMLNPDKTEYVSPPLWGKNGYNDAAGLYRVSNFAKYVKNNMPQGATYQKPQLSDEEAWDVAAYVNSQPRPHLDTPKDWPDKSKKPIDHPFGPYADQFTAQQHKFGPFKEMGKGK